MKNLKQEKKEEKHEKNEKDKNAKNDLIYSVVGYPHIGIRLVLVPAE